MGYQHNTDLSLSPVLLFSLSKERANTFYGMALCIDLSQLAIHKTINARFSTYISQLLIFVNMSSLLIEEAFTPKLSLLVLARNF